MLGTTVERALEERDATFFPPEEARTMADEEREVMDSRSPRTYEKEVTVGGSKRVFATIKAPYLDASGRVVGTIVPGE